MVGVRTLNTRLKFILEPAYIGIAGILLAGAACAAPSVRSESTPIKAEAAKAMTPQEQFELLIRSRNDDYETQRRILFANADYVAYLPQRFDDSDRVVAFIARELHSWATHPEPEYEQFEAFLKTGLAARKSEQSRTAAGWKPAQDVAGYLHRDGNKRTTQQYALLRALMRPADPYVLDGVNLYFYSHPVSEPEVLIRLNLESPIPGSAEGLATLSLRQIDSARALQAIDHERKHASNLKQSFPEELGALRIELTSTPAR
jgi:hypothetical protein